MMIRIAADVSQLRRNLAEGRDSIETTAASMRRMVSGFSGDRLIQTAHTITAAVHEIGGASRLTEAEQARVNATVEKALEKYKALGREAPQAMKDLARETKQTESVTDQLKAKFQGLGPLIVGAFSVAAVTSAIRSYADFTSQINDLSAKTGIGAEALQRLKFAAEQNGATLDQVTTAVTKLGVKLAGEDKSAVGGLEALGLSFTKIRGMAPDQAFTAIADAIAKVEDPMARSKLAMDLFGKSGAELLPMMRGNLTETAAAADRLGIVLSDKAVKAGDAFGDKMSALTSVGKAVIGQVLEPMIPALTTVATWLGEFVPAAINGARTAFDWLIRKVMEAEVGLRGFILRVNELGAQVPWLGEKLGASTQNLAAMKEGLQFAKDKLAAFEQQTQTAGQANATAARTMSTLNLNYDENAKATSKAAKAAEEFKQRQDALFGRDLIEKANEYVKQLGDIGNVSRLSADKKKELHAAVTGAIQAYERLGDVAPATLREIVTLTQEAITVTRNLSAGGWEPYRKGVQDAGAALHDLASGSIPEAGQRTAELDAQLKTWANTTGAVLPAAIRQNKPALDEAANSTAVWRDRLGELSQALSQLAQVSGDSFGAVVQHLATVITAMNVASRAGETMRTGWNQMDGSLRGNVAGMINMGVGALGAASAIGQATASGNTLTRMLGGMATGAAAGAAFGPIGSAVGAAAGAITGLIRGLGGVSEEVKKVRVEVDQFQAALANSLTATQRAEAGGSKFAMTMIAIRDAVAATGGTAQQAELLVRDLLNTDRPEAARRAMESINKVLGDQKAILEANAKQLADWQSELASLTAGSQVSWKSMQEAAQRYGIDLASLGPQFQSGRLHETAQTIWDDFILLQRGGASVGGTLFGMRDEISQLARESVRFGTTIPENFRPLIQHLFETGNLLDENGEALKELPKINFGDPIVAKLDALVIKIGELIDKIAAAGTNSVTGALTKMGTEGEAAGGVVDIALRGVHHMAGNVDARLRQTDWEGWGRRGRDAADDVADAVDRLNFGSSPGGLKEIPILLGLAERASDAAGLTMSDGFTDLNGVLNKLLETLRDLIDAIKTINNTPIAPKFPKIPGKPGGGGDDHKYGDDMGGGGIDWFGKGPGDKGHVPEGFQYDAGARGAPMGGPGQAAPTAAGGGAPARLSTLEEQVSGLREDMAIDRQILPELIRQMAVEVAQLGWRK